MSNRARWDLSSYKGLNILQSKKNNENMMQIQPTSYLSSANIYNNNFKGELQYSQSNIDAKGNTSNNSSSQLQYINSTATVKTPTNNYNEILIQDSFNNLEDGIVEKLTNKINLTIVSKIEQLEISLKAYLNNQRSEIANNFRIIENKIGEIITANIGMKVNIDRILFNTENLERNTKNDIAVIQLKIAELQSQLAGIDNQLKSNAYGFQTLLPSKVANDPILNTNETLTTISPQFLNDFHKAIQLTKNESKHAIDQIMIDRTGPRKKITDDNMYDEIFWNEEKNKSIDENLSDDDFFN